MIRVRFNLGRGSNYKKWKILNTETKEVVYLSPEEVSLTLINCTLKNNKVASKRIFEGHSKYVCAYIECEGYSTVSSNSFGGEIMYNPRKCTHWTDCEGNDLDNMKFDLLITKGNKVYERNEFTAIR